MAKSSDRGFTLIEIIVALALITSVFAALYQIYAVGWRGVRLARLEASALELARAELASAGIETPLVEGTQSGSTPDGVIWTRSIRAIVPLDDERAHEPGPQGYWVTVRVEWHGGRSLELTTLKLAKGNS